MKVATEITSLTRASAGIYRYSANLIMAIRKVDPAVELTPVILADPLLLGPTNPVLFEELFGGKPVVEQYRVTRRWGNKEIHEITRSAGFFHRGYQKTRKEVAGLKGRSGILGRLRKLEREFYRGMAKAIDFFRNLPYQRMERLYAPTGTDVLHSMNNALPVEFGKVRPRLTCQTIHDIIPLLFKHSHFKYFDKLVDSARRADLIITVSESTKRDLLQVEGFSDKHIVAVPLAADPQFHTAPADAVNAIRAKIGISENIPYFLSVSTLEPRKNFPFLLRAFKKVVESYGDIPCRLVLCGRIGWGTDVHEEIRDLIKQLDGLVCYTGFVSDEELNALYTGAEAFLFPSIYEGFGLPLLESMACGTPVISSNTSSMPEVVGDAGILLSPTKEQSWVDAMIWMLRLTPQEKEIHSRKAYERASLFSWEETAKQTLAAYQSALDRKK
jgi:glycosyltransferase involved in cell wall biosynthesis